MGTVLRYGVPCGLSLPESIILRRVLKDQLIGVFIGTVAIELTCPVICSSLSYKQSRVAG
jgi:hypothetical protein